MDDADDDDDDDELINLRLRWKKWKKGGGWRDNSGAGERERLQ